ncbi:MAG: hypothetical protein L3J97_01255 [Thermoplasmata archaeon]|nr:hypothetical protein [Thermoplasmata archaeon]
MPVSRMQVEEAVASARSRPERIRFLGALLEKATAEEAIIVGGSAIEIYTSGRTATMDIDVVMPRTLAIQVVESWGLVRTGRIWRRKDWDIDIDLVGPKFTGSRRKILVMETPYGPVRLAGVEDLLVKRLAELKHWPTAPAWREGLVQQIEILMSEYGDKMDEEYLAFIARRDDVVDILSDFQERRRRSGDTRRE